MEQASAVDGRGLVATAALDGEPWALGNQRGGQCRREEDRSAFRKTKVPCVDNQKRLGLDRRVSAPLGEELCEVACTGAIAHCGILSNHPDDINPGRVVVISTRTRFDTAPVLWS